MKEAPLPRRLDLGYALAREEREEESQRTMSRRILLVRHMPGERDDRVSRLLAERGFELETVQVSEGQPLPEPDERYLGAVVFGGAQMASEAEKIAYLNAELSWIERWLAADKAYLGICLGAQMLARALGARVARHPEGLSEIGFFPLRPTQAGRSLLPEELTVYHWHSEGFDLPRDSELLAEGTLFPQQAFRCGRRAFGLQFHPEVTEKIIHDWLEAAAHMLTYPGAQPRERQLAELHRLPSLWRWLEGFVENWLILAQGKPAPAAPTRSLATPSGQS